MIVLGWRQPARAIVTQWRGPDGSIAATALDPLTAPVAAVIGPPGTSGQHGQAVIVMPGAGGALEAETTIAAPGVEPGAVIFVSLAPAPDAAENGPEWIDLLALSGTALTGAIAISASFATPVSGPVTLNWSAL